MIQEKKSYHENNLQDSFPVQDIRPQKSQKEAATKNSIKESMFFCKDIYS